MNDLNESIIDLPRLNSIKLGDSALVGRWDNSCSLIMESNIDINELIIDLPHLNSIKLGTRALFGMPYVPSCSLIMEGNIDMNELIFRSS